MRNRIIVQDAEEVFNRDIEWECFRNSTVLITGAYGMIASYLTYMLLYLNEKQHFNIHIVAMVRSEEKFFARFGENCKDNNVTVVTDSINQPIQIEGDVDYIIHAASLASPKYYKDYPVDVLVPNVVGTYHLLQLAVEKKVKKVVFFSSGSIYGTVNDAYVREETAGAIDPLDTRSCYSESKRMGETMCCAYKRQYNVPAVILRIWHTYAPTMDIDNDPRVFASFMKNVVYGRNIEIKSDGNEKRAFLYIADAVAGIFTAITKGTDGEAYNLCNTEQHLSVSQLAEILSKLRTDIDIKPVHTALKKTEKYIESVSKGTAVPDNGKLRSLGWSPRYTIEDGFKRVLEYQLNRENDDR